MSIFVLTFWDIEEEGEMNDFYFSSLENAKNFIEENFSWDKPRRLTLDHYEGKNNRYVINKRCVDQTRI